MHVHMVEGTIVQHQLIIKRGSQMVVYGTGASGFLSTHHLSLIRLMLVSSVHHAHHHPSLISRCSIASERYLAVQNKHHRTPDMRTVLKQVNFF